MNLKRTLRELGYCTVLSSLMLSSCSPDWGKADPPAGDQVLASREVVGTFSFDGEGTVLSTMDKVVGVEGVNYAEVKNDSLKKTTLMLNGACLRTTNPFKSVKLQNGAAVTFWVYSKDTVDLDDILIRFGSENADSAEFYMTKNAEIVYNKSGQSNYDENNPDEYKTGVIVPDQWHFIALQVSTDGYTLYADGIQSNVATGRDWNAVVSAINHADYVYLGNTDGSIGETYLADITFIRNQMQESDWNKKYTGKESGGSEDDKSFEYVVGDFVQVVGAEDNTSAWWSEFSNYYRIPSESSMTFNFTNYTSGTGGNWNNWNLAITTDDARGGDDYSEYFVIRSDLYGWGDCYASGTWSNEGYPSDDDGWATFRTDMVGADVVVNVERSGSTVTVTATATCTNNTVYVEKFTTECGDGTQVIRAFFIADGSHLDFNKDGCFVEKKVDVTTTTVGAEDNSSAWWSEFSDYFQIPSNAELDLAFTNYTSGTGGNWNNWNLAITTDDERGGDDYAEYFVIRSDLYGWGDSYASGTWSNEGYPSDDDGWAEFRTNMVGADVVLNIERSGSTVTVTATETCTNSTVYVEKFTTDCGDGTQVIRAFLIADGSHLGMDSDRCKISIPLFD